jgi:replicative DNA helicase
MSDELFNRAAEQVLLSGLLRHPDDYYAINNLGLLPEHFGSREARYCFSAIQRVTDEKRTPDNASVLEALRADGHGTSEPYMSGLLKIPCSLAQAKDAAQTVKGLAVSRALVEFGVKTIEAAKENRSDYEAAIGEIEAEFASIRRGMPKSPSSPDIADIIKDLKFSTVQAGIPIQFSPSLQHYTGGLVPGWLWVVGGFSSVGKSAVACNFILDVLSDESKWVGVISTEMPKESYAIRLLSAMSGVPQRNIRERVALGGDAITRVDDAERKLSGANLRIFDNVYSLKGIRATATRMSKMEGLDVLVVDFIQNLTNTGDEVADARSAIIGIQELAKELRCTVIAFSQISNSQAQYALDSNSDDNYYSFKGSGAIRDAADVAIMLRRDQQAQSRFLDMRVVKNRHEQLGKITLKMELETGKISEHNAEA